MRHVAFFLLGFFVSIFIGIGTANAAWCTTVSGGALTVPASPSTQADLSACTGPVLLSSSEFATVQSINQSILPVNPQLAIDDSLQMFGLSFVFLVTIWAGRKVYEQFVRGKEE